MIAQDHERISPSPIEIPQTPQGTADPRAAVIADLSRRMTELVAVGDLETARQVHGFLASLLADPPKAETKEGALVLLRPKRGDG